MLRIRGRFFWKNSLVLSARSGSIVQRAPITRAYSSNGDILNRDEPLSETKGDDETKQTVSEAAQPWYLTMVKRDKSQNLSDLNVEEIKYPKNCPTSLQKITEHLKNELGLKNILIFDLKDDHGTDYSTAVAKISDFVVIGTARSAKHCQKSFTELNGMLKQDFNSVAYVEGNVNAREERKRIKRMARKANLGKSWGSNSGSTSTGFAKDSEAWFMIDCHVDNIFVNILTKKRREELNLEELYAPEDERANYQRHIKHTEEAEFDATHDAEESNILTGLRRLAYQRRQYSTLIPSAADSLKSALQANDFKEAADVIENNSDFAALPLLQTITEAFSNLNVTTDAINEIEQWLELFETCWPLVLPAKNSFQYWSLRLKFLKMLNVANPQLYPCYKIIDDYLIRKRTMGHRLSKDDFLQFLQMVKINLNLLEHGTYWDLVKSNEQIVIALKSYNEIDFLNDDLVLSMLLKSMVLENNTSVKLHSLYEVIDFLCSQPKNLSSNVIVTVLETLASIQDWNKLFQFWEVGIKGIIPGQDYRPWNKFIRILVNSNDIELMQKLIDEGHLLWLKRNEVEMTPELVDELNKLFKIIEYDLKLYLDI